MDTETPRFLEFEKWWGGYFLMNREEIRWIVENLFIGNSFARGEISSGAGATFNMRSVRSPVIVFASAGDNITPPGQALRWIADVYRDEQEIKTLGQTIVYLMHEDIGHLGIFVSGAVALKEHTEIAETLQLIDSVAPGLYEMLITHQDGGKGGRKEWQVELKERTMADIRARSGEAKNEAFPAVARISALNQSVYDLFVAPVVRQMATEESAELRRQMNPMRLRRTLVSDRNPAMAPVAGLAEAARANRRPAAPDQPLPRLGDGSGRSGSSGASTSTGTCATAGPNTPSTRSMARSARWASPAATRRRRPRRRRPRRRGRRSAPRSPASPRAAMPRRSSA